MTVVNPKSISGINSITMASGGDDLLTIHSNNTTERVRVNNSGDVIIGSGVTLSPDGDIFATGITTISENLKVGTGVTISPDGDAFFTGVCTATSFSGDGSNLTGLSGVSVANQSDNRLITATGTTDALNGESGLTYDGSTLQVSGNVDLSDNNKLMIGDGDDLQIDHSGTNSQIYHNGTGSLYIATLGSGEDLNLQSTSGKMTFTTGGSERLRITDDGIKFNGDNAAANALHDYEEGEHTITTNSNLTASSSYNKADYTKVGNMVTVTMLLYVSNVSGSDNVSVSLPFTNRSESVPRMCNTVGSVMFKGVDTGDNGLIPYLDDNGSTLRFYRLYDNNSSWYQLNNSHLSVGDELYITITYKTAT